MSVTSLAVPRPGCGIPDQSRLASEGRLHRDSDCWRRRTGAGGHNSLKRQAGASSRRFTGSDPVAPGPGWPRARFKPT
eukprot:3608050-Rhodomonas_salina.2